MIISSHDHGNCELCDQIERERDEALSQLAGIADCINQELRENGPHDDQIEGIGVDMRPFVRRLVDRVNARHEKQSAYAVNVADALQTLRAEAANFRAYCKGESPSLFSGEDHNVFDFDCAMERAGLVLAKNPDQRQGADSPASQVSDPSTSASSAHGVTTPADSAPSDVRSEVAQSAPATNAALTETLTPEAAAELLEMFTRDEVCMTHEIAAEAARLLRNVHQMNSIKCVPPFGSHTHMFENGQCVGCGVKVNEIGRIK